MKGDHFDPHIPFEVDPILKLKGVQTALIVDINLLQNGPAVRCRVMSQ